jgi:cytochrome b
MTKTYVWSLFTRGFHILLVLAVGVVYITSDVDNLLSYHVIFGYFIGLLFIYRILWDFIDIRYSKFRDFNFNIKELILYILNIFGDKKVYIGHNPASSWAIITIILLGLLSVTSGIIVYGIQEGMGILSYLNNSFFRNMELFKELHELFANSFIAIIFIHIVGVSLDKIFNNSDAIKSMLNGYKISNKKSLKLTIIQKIFGFFWIGSSLFLLIYLLGTPTNILISDGNKVIEYNEEQPIFYEECKSCHTLYAPFLLPKKSWIKIMDNLSNHFGDDASLELEDINSIKEYLTKNSAENSTKESSYKILNSMKDIDTISITKTPYWKKRHKDIDKEIFNRKEVGKVSNCKACHIYFEKGLLNDKDIKIPIL